MSEKPDDIESRLQKVLLHLMKRAFDECGIEKTTRFIQRVEAGEHDVPSPWVAPPTT